MCRHKTSSFSLIAVGINARRQLKHDSAVVAVRHRRSAGCFNRGSVQLVWAEEESKEGEKRGPNQTRWKKRNTLLMFFLTNAALVLW